MKRSPAPFKLYGIANCDTVKRARAWLDAHALAYEFHDYKKHGVDLARLERWADTVDWERLLNRSGTTWRKLPEERRERVTNAREALGLMCEQPSVIKRPVLERDGAATLLVGFDSAQYESLLSS